MGDFNLDLVIIAIVVCFLILTINFYQLVNYQHPDDVNPAYFPKTVGLTIAGHIMRSSGGRDPESHFAFPDASARYPDACSPDATVPVSTAPYFAAPDSATPDDFAPTTVALTPDASDPDPSSTDASGPDPSSPDSSDPAPASPDASGLAPASPNASSPDPASPHSAAPMLPISIHSLGILSCRSLGILRFFLTKSRSYLISMLLVLYSTVDGFKAYIESPTMELVSIMLGGGYLRCS